MAVHIGQLTTELIAEPEQQLAGSAASSPSDPMEEQARIRFALAESLRLDQRTRAEGYDD